ncbi:MAG: hypothetical protein C4320_05545 [Armatimonadota bacterium]
MEKTVRVGLLGFGTVGTGVYRMLADNRESVARKAGIGISVTRIGIRDADKPREAPSPMVTTDLMAIVDDPEIDVIVEVMGGMEPAQSLVERALRNGKHVVTANKEMIARQGSHLVTIARDLGLDLHYEAAVGGGIPLVQPMKHQLAGNDIVRMIGILNGTSNYILTRMEEDELSFAEALAEAQVTPRLTRRVTWTGSIPRTRSPSSPPSRSAGKSMWTWSHARGFGQSAPTTSSTPRTSGSGSNCWELLMPSKGDGFLCGCIRRWSPSPILSVRSTGCTTRSGCGETLSGT